MTEADRVQFSYLMFVLCWHQGFWHRLWQDTTGWVTLASTTIEIPALRMWDAHSQGMFGQILLAAPQRASFSLQMFYSCDWRQVVFAEAKIPHRCLPLSPNHSPVHPASSPPCTLVDRHVDNVDRFDAQT